MATKPSETTNALLKAGFIKAREANPGYPIPLSNGSAGALLKLVDDLAARPKKIELDL